MFFTPFTTTGIGSLPHRDPEEALEFVLRCFDIPFWPQLPRMSFKESMVAQFSEGMPFLRLDNERETVSVIRDQSDELERFYEGCTEGARIAISSEFAAGLHCFLKKLKASSPLAIKGHITGPLTFTLSLRDGSGKYIYFDEELREIALMTLKAKTLWQIDLLKQITGNVLIFIDEPVFTAIGSTAFMGVDGNEVVRLLREITGVIREAGAISCIHCCGKADWKAVIASNVDMLSFDSFDYFETFNLYASDIKEFLLQGGGLAWGIVPTSDSLLKATYDDVFHRLHSNIMNLSKTIDKELISTRSLLTPSCGLGSRTIDEAIKVVQILMRLREDMT